MKVSLTEGQLRSFNNRIIYEGILDNMVFKISLIVEDGKTEPDMEWDFTNIKKDIDIHEDELKVTNSTFLQVGNNLKNLGYK